MRWGSWVITIWMNLLFILTSEEQRSLLSIKGMWTILRKAGLLAEVPENLSYWIEKSHLWPFIQLIGRDTQNSGTGLLLDYSLHPLSISYTRCMMNESSFLGRPREFSASLQIFIRSGLRRTSDNDRGFLTTARVLEKTCPSLKHLTEEGGGRSKGLLATGVFPSE